MLYQNYMVDWNSILENVISGAIGGLIATALLKLISILQRPQLDIKFDQDDTFTIARCDNVPNKPNGLFVHLNVHNKRKSTAYGCKVFLLKLEEKIHGSFQPIDLNIHYTLKWANENEPKGYEGLEIPGKYRRRVDFIHSIQAANIFLLFIEGGSRGIRNGFANGEYRFTLQASGTNTNTVKKKYIVKWNGNFDKDNIKIKEDK